MQRFKLDLPTIRHGTFGPPQALSRHGLLGELRVAAPGVAHEGDGLAGHHANVLHITWGWDESWDGDGEKTMDLLENCRLIMMGWDGWDESWDFRIVDGF